MLVEKITSRQNPLVKRFRRLRNGAERNLMLIEGVKMMEEALAAGAHFESIAFTSDLELTERGLVLQDELQRVPCRGALLSQQVMDYISDTETPQGVAAMVSRPNFTIGDVFAAPSQLIVIADGIQDPGNVGTIMRTAEAAGSSGLVALPGTASPFGSKAVRASMGSVLRLPVAAGPSREELISMARERKVALVVASPERFLPVDASAKTRPYTEADYRSPTGLIFGSEGSGVSEELASEASVLVHIPMASGVESLNVATAASIVLYEVARQRGFSFGRPETGGRKSRRK
ncbi:MAG TPA: RNA methyltransferase [Blastocatellia bacterium]